MKVILLLHLNYHLFPLYPLVSVNINAISTCRLEKRKGMEKNERVTKESSTKVGGHLLECLSFFLKGYLEANE